MKEVAGGTVRNQTLLMDANPKSKTFLENKVRIPAPLVLNENGHETVGRERSTDELIKSPRVFDIWKNYAQCTTLHGLRHVVNSNTMKAQRITWVVFIIIMLVVLVALTTTQISRFLQHHTVNKQYQTIADRLEFPTVTICSFNRVSDKSVEDPLTRSILRNIYVTGKANSTLLKDLDPKVTKSMNVTDIFIKGASKINETFLGCYWQNVQIKCTDYFRYVYLSDRICFAFNSKEYIRETGKRLETVHTGGSDGLIVQMDARQGDYFIGDSGAAGFKVLVHEPFQEPMVSKLGFAVSPGKSTFVAVKKTKLSFLPKPVKAFGNMECIDKIVRKLKYFDTYSYDACVEECAGDLIISECGCKEVLFPGNARTCDPIELIGCVETTKDTFSKTHCDCQMPCEVTHYNVQLSTALFPRVNFMRLIDEEKYNKIGSYENRVVQQYISANWLEMRVYFDTKLYTVQEQVPELTDADLWASIGGYLGLFLGASIHSALEFCEFLTYATKYAYRRWK
ncbi:hypothetical protein ScPMuIL_010008 [Solemya velum]